MTIKIDYFTDVLCVWAYGGQVRIDELKNDFADDIEIEYRFIPIFAAAKEQIARVWQGKGEFEGFNQHLQKVAKDWDHIPVANNLWTEVAPESSTPAHLYLKAIQLLTKSGDISDLPLKELNGRTLFEEAAWLFRVAFFRQALDISRRSVQDDVAQQLKLPLKKIHQLIDSGQAHAALHLDEVARDSYKIPGSPTLVLNEGRQLLYGNVGYRIIDANVRELLHDPHQGEASWC